MKHPHSDSCSLGTASQIHMTGDTIVIIYSMWMPTKTHNLHTDIPITPLFGTFAFAPATKYFRWVKLLSHELSIGSSRHLDGTKDRRFWRKARHFVCCLIRVNLSDNGAHYELMEDAHVAVVHLEYKTSLLVFAQVMDRWTERVQYREEPRPMLCERAVLPHQGSWRYLLGGKSCAMPIAYPEIRFQTTASTA
jgi:hypothetical protein